MHTLNKNELVVNSSYKDFFIDPTNMRRDFFIEPIINKLNTLENIHLTRSLALLLKQFDRNQSTIYGVEIKSNGSERSSRIPLVRYSKESASIWKIANSIDSLEKSMIVLNDLFNFLKEHSGNLYPLPRKVIILKDSESLFSGKNSKYSTFVENIVSRNDVKLISFDFIRSYLEQKKPIDLDQILEKSHKSIFTALDV